MMKQTRKTLGVLRSKSPLFTVIALVMMVNTGCGNPLMKELLRSPVEDYSVPPEPPVYAVGDTGPAGGIIFFVDTTDAYPGFNYLEAAPTDLGTSTWAINTYATTSISGTLTTMGSGAANTALIVGTAGTDAPAAYACDDLSLNGYTDWFLPSQAELNEMYSNRVSIGGFGIGGYWTSSETNSSYAWNQSFSGGLQGSYSKNLTYSVRAVRAF
ncbi:MAG: DUF1566 domain-containing protein [Treponema sp.]|jgi:hypothetical protein|nr:DUF1566 domain-containing protein [Treponema sp.]